VLGHAGPGASLAWVVSHARGHGVAGWRAWVLLHSDWMWRKRWIHASHHLRAVDYPQRGYRREVLRVIACEAWREARVCQMPRGASEEDKGARERVVARSEVR